MASSLVQAVVPVETRMISLKFSLQRGIGRSTSNRVQQLPMKLPFTKNVKNATWPEGCSHQNEKTEKTRKPRKPENEKTVFAFSSFRVFVLLCSILAFSCFCAFAFLCCRVFGFRVFASSRFRVFAFSRFRVFAFFRFRSFAFSRFRRFRVFVFSRFRHFAFSCFMFNPGVFAFSCFCECISACCAKPFSCCNQNVRVQSATEWTASVHTCPKL